MKHFCKIFRLEKLPKKDGYEFYEYQGEGHGFMNASADIKKMMKTGDLPTDPSPDSQSKAWDRVFAFLDKVLL